MVSLSKLQFVRDKRHYFHNVSIIIKTHLFNSNNTYLMKVIAWHDTIFILITFVQFSCVHFNWINIRHSSIQYEKKNRCLIWIQMYTCLFYFNNRVDERHVNDSLIKTLILMTFDWRFASSFGVNDANGLCK